MMLKKKNNNSVKIKETSLKQAFRERAKNQGDSVLI